MSLPTPLDPSAEPDASTPLITPLGWLAYAVALLAVVLDQISKYLVLQALPFPGASMRLLPILNLTMVWNPGVSFGLLRSGGPVGRLMLAGFAASVVTGLAIWARGARRPITAIGLGLVMGGAVGNNLIDRLRFGRVEDFIDVSGLGFFPWVFNVADSAISIGVVLLIVDSLWPPTRQDP
jgi:signal peptidase II